MDPELQAEIESVMDTAAVAELTQRIARDVDLILSAEAHKNMAVKSVLLSGAMQRGPGYMAALLISATRKSYAMAKAYAGVGPEDSRTFQIEHDPDEDAGYRRAHTLIDNLSDRTPEELPDFCASLEEEVGVMDLVDQGKLYVHTFTLCDALIRCALEEGEARLHTTLRLEDEGDSRS